MTESPQARELLAAALRDSPKPDGLTEHPFAFWDDFEIEAFADSVLERAPLALSARPSLSREAATNRVTDEILSDFRAAGGLKAILETANSFPRIRSIMWLRVNQALTADAIVALGGDG